MDHDGARPPSTRMPPLSDEAKDALRAADEISDGRDIGSDHVLLGLVMSPDRIAAQVVTQFAVAPTAIRDELRRLRDSNP